MCVALELEVKIMATTTRRFVILFRQLPASGVNFMLPPWHESYYIYSGAKVIKASDHRRPCRTYESLSYLTVVETSLRNYNLDRLIGLALAAGGK